MVSKLLLLLVTVRGLFQLGGASDVYHIQSNEVRQQIWGLGYEIQSDSISSGNSGLPDQASGVPHDLTTDERTRFYTEMLRAGGDRGFRYCRLALGLYFRGMDESGKYLQDRYEGQSAELAEMIREGNVEGIDAEYWSPEPYWKSNNSYVGGSLKSFDDGFLEEFSDAVLHDLDYLSSRGLPITMWGLQNEPFVNYTSYSCCGYSAQQYYDTFSKVGPKVRQRYPDTIIHVDSNDGWTGPRGQQIIANPSLLELVDAWTYHRIGSDSNTQITGDFTSGAQCKPVFQNEFEYQHANISAYDTLNTAQSVINWMVFQNSPSWYWLHALKPIANSESEGYSLGYWRPPNDTDYSHFPDLKPGHWVFNDANWNALAGFLRYMPWDSYRLNVVEPSILQDQRIMAWRTPSNKNAFVLTNRGNSSFTFDVQLDNLATYWGHQYSPTVNDETIGDLTGHHLQIKLDPHTIQFWTSEH